MTINELKTGNIISSSAAEKNDRIAVVAQQFYGNRTGTAIRREELEYFIRGSLADHMPWEIEGIDLRVVRVPGTEQIVIVYDQTQEDQYVQVDFPETYEKDAAKYFEHTGRELTMHTSCEIPEIGFKIYTRCIACRMDENGILQSLQEGDYEKFIHYFPER